MPATKPRIVSMRICCDAIEKRGQSQVYDLIPLLTDLSESCIRYSLTRAVALGYLVEGENSRPGFRGARKTYIRTDKKFPKPVVEDDAIDRFDFDMSAYVPRRDWAVVALFGPYEARA